MIASTVNFCRCLLCSETFKVCARLEQHIGKSHMGLNTEEEIRLNLDLVNQYKETVTYTEGGGDINEQLPNHDSKEVADWCDKSVYACKAGLVFVPLEMK